MKAGGPPGRAGGNAHAMRTPPPQNKNPEDEALAAGLPPGQAKKAGAGGPGNAGEPPAHGLRRKQEAAEAARQKAIEEAKQAAQEAQQARQRDEMVRQQVVEQERVQREEIRNLDNRRIHEELARTRVETKPKAGLVDAKRQPHEEARLRDGDRVADEIGEAAVEKVTGTLAPASSGPDGSPTFHLATAGMGQKKRAI